MDVKALGYAAFLPTVITLGSLVCEAARVLGKNRLAASASRVGLSRNSKVFPSESTARERYIQGF